MRVYNRRSPREGRPTAEEVEFGRESYMDDLPRNAEGFPCASVRVPQWKRNQLYRDRTLNKDSAHRNESPPWFHVRQLGQGPGKPDSLRED